jgi:hypothetical protein
MAIDVATGTTASFVRRQAVEDHVGLRRTLNGADVLLRSRAGDVCRPRSRWFVHNVLFPHPQNTPHSRVRLVDY